MGLKSTTGKLPAFSGPLTAEVPTATYSGVSDASDGDVSINPYTNQGPGAGGTGLTTSEVEAAREAAGAGALTLSTNTTFDPSGKSIHTILSNGNLTALMPNSGIGATFTVHSQSSGKWYWEVTLDAFTGTHSTRVGVANTSASNEGQFGADANGWTALSEGGSVGKYHNNNVETYGTGWTTSDIIMVALDIDNTAVWFGVNGTWFDGATLSEIAAGTTTNAAYTNLTGTIYPSVSDNSNERGGTYTANFGATDFAHTVPTGFYEGFGVI